MIFPVNIYMRSEIIAKSSSGELAFKGENIFADFTDSQMMKKGMRVYVKKRNKKITRKK